jgi:hypothetical protein
VSFNFNRGVRNFIFACVMLGDIKGLSEDFTITNSTVTSGSNTNLTLTVTDTNREVESSAGVKLDGGDFKLLSNGEKYSGHWENGMRSGYGAGVRTNGLRYEGNWRSNYPNGEGTLYFPNGAKYVGNLMNGWRDGFGTFTMTNGLKYQGGWKHGARQGHGEIFFADGNRYDGEWAGNRRNGNGTMYLTNGGVYSGAWRFDHRNGYGVYTNSNGLKAVGEWADGGMVSGTWTMADGTRIEGTWYRLEHKSGGVIIWRDGRIYRGEWPTNSQGHDDIVIDHLLQGRGTMTWPDGRKYVGNFSKGKLDGIGQMNFADGRTQGGWWHEDKFDRDLPADQVMPAITQRIAGTKKATTESFAEYDLYIKTTVQANWNQLIREKGGLPFPGRFVVQFHLYFDGTISHVETVNYGRTIEPEGASIGALAIREAAPFLPMPSDMARLYAVGYREINFTFYYRM